jgi:hypothetical protein
MALAAALVCAPAQAANRRMFSYDPADDATRHVAGDLTFDFTQHLASTTVFSVRSTEGDATARLAHAGEGALGPGGLGRLIGQGAAERDLYEVLPADQGAAMIAAFCPGSGRAWMAFPRLRANRDIRVQVLGDSAAGGPARLCHTLRFSFHGEWKLPPGPQVDERLMRRPSFPY